MTSFIYPVKIEELIASETRDKQAEAREHAVRYAMGEVGENDDFTAIERLIDRANALSRKRATAEECERIIGCLNECAGTEFRPTAPRTRSLIDARMREKYTVEDFETVIRYKSDQWLGDERMSGYLRPETLFGGKFEGYLNEARAKNTAVGSLDCDSFFNAALERTYGGT